MATTKPIVLVLTGPLTAADVRRLCDELAAQPCPAGTEAICDVSGLEQPGPAAVDALARLHLTARRRGARIRLRGAGRELLLMLDLMGLGGLFEGARGSPQGADEETAYRQAKE